MAVGSVVIDSILIMRMARASWKALLDNSLNVNLGNLGLVLEQLRNPVMVRSLTMLAANIASTYIYDLAKISSS